MDPLLITVCIILGLLLLVGLMFAAGAFIMVALAGAYEDLSDTEDDLWK